MHRHVLRQFGFLKTTLLGGVIFLLPLIVIGFLLAQVVKVVLLVAAFLRDTLGIDTASGYAVVLAGAVAAVILVCFAAGLAARWTIGRRLMSFVESRLTLIFPRYAIYKDQLAGGIGGEFVQGELKPVVATMLDGSARLALEVDRTADGVAAVYFPSAPDSWSGTVAFVPAERVTPLTADFGEVMATFEKLGRNSLGVAGVSRSVFEPRCDGSGEAAFIAVSAPPTDPGGAQSDK